MVTAAERRAWMQPLPPPYLVTTGTFQRGVSLEVTADTSTTVVEMTVHGTWSPQLGNQVTESLRRCLASPCEALVVDVRNVTDLHGISMPYWSAVARTAQLGPAPVHVAFCLPPATMLDYRLRHQDGEPSLLFATMTQARIAIAGRVSRPHRLHARLAPRPTSVRAARDLVAHACHTWQPTGVRDDAVLIMSELAANAVDHAGTDFVATVSRRANRLHLTVRDGDNRYPRMGADADHSMKASLADRGRGLRLVHGTAVAWGAMPAHSGKVVWATLAGQT